MLEETKNSRYNWSTFQVLLHTNGRLKNCFKFFFRGGGGGGLCLDKDIHTFTFSLAQALDLLLQSFYFYRFDSTVRRRRCRLSLALWGLPGSAALEAPLVVSPKKTFDANARRLISIRSSFRSRRRDRRRFLFWF